MKSTSHGISMWRMRSARKNTAPLRTPTSSRSRSAYSARDLLAQGAHALLEVVGLDEDLADAGVAHRARKSSGEDDH